MKWLIRHFLARTFDSEMFSARGQWATVAISLFALLLPAGMILLMVPDGSRGAAKDLLVFVRVICIMALITLFTAHALFPTRRDLLAFAGMPVSPRRIFLARFAATLILALAVTVALAVPLSNSPARLGSLTLGCLPAFFSIAAIQGLALNLSSPRIATLVQVVLIVAALGTGLATWTIAPFPGRVPPLSALLRATAFSACLAILLYALTAARYRRLLLGESGRPPGLPFGGKVFTSKGQARGPTRLLARDPRRRAILDFCFAVLGRSRLHRMVLAGYVAGGIALMINTTLVVRAAWNISIGDAIGIYWPLGLTFVLLAGIRHAFRMPAELRANWIFQTTESQGRREWMSAIERLVVCCVILPVHVAILPLAGWRLILLNLLVSLAVFELLFQGWQQLPFTCSYVPGRNNLMQLLAAWLAILCLAVPLVANLLALAAPRLPWFLLALAICAFGWTWCRRQRREGWGEAPLLYEDSLDLMSLTAAHRTMQTSSSQEPLSPVAAAVRACRALTGAFPEDFRKTDLLHATEDSIRPVFRRQGIRGLLRLLSDLALRLPIEHALDLGKDLRYGVRALAATPGFTAAALTSLTLGICISTCAISEMNGIVLREIPEVARPHELVATQLPISYPAYQRFRTHPELFSASAVYIAPVPFDVTLHQRPERAWGHFVTSGYFATFGIRPALGTFFDASYDVPGRPPAVVISHRFWRDHLAGDRSIIGSSLRINGRQATVLGVAPPDFLGASPIFFTADLFLPAATDPSLSPELGGNLLERPGAAPFRFVARLRSGRTRAQAEAALAAAAIQFDRDQGASASGERARRLQLVDGGKLFPMRSRDLSLFTVMLTLLAGLIMLIACASVANMMLARAAARRREMAVRLALGASRARIMRQLIAESMLITGAAAVVGFVGCVWLMHALTDIQMPFPMPMSYGYLGPDRRVLLMTLMFTTITGVLFGLVPARQALRTGLSPALKEGGNVMLGRYRWLSLRNILIVSQVAGSLTLLVILGLLSVGIQNTLGVQTGFDPAHLSMLSLDPVRDGYPPDRAADLLQRVLERVQSLPSVTAAALTESVPVAMALDTVTVSNAGSIRHAIRHVAGKDYFTATRIPILNGRAFRREDETGPGTGVIVSAAFAAEVFRGVDPVGRRLTIGTPDPSPATTLPGSFDYRSLAARPLQTVEIVGVAGDVAEGLIAQKPRPAIYFPLRAQHIAHPSIAGLTLVVRSIPGVDAISLVRREIAAIDPNVATFNPRTMQEHVDKFMGMLRVASWTYGLIGIFGYVLAGVGLAGVTAYAVQQRRREIGIRMALGARAGGVLGLVMREGAVLVAIGTAIGLAGAWAGSRGLAAMNHTVGTVTSTRPDDPFVIVGATALLAVMALLACYLPARQTTRIDPALALRQE